MVLLRRQVGHRVRRNLRARRALAAGADLHGPGERHLLPHGEQLGRGARAGQAGDVDRHVLHDLEPGVRELRAHLRSDLKRVQAGQSEVRQGGHRTVAGDRQEVSRLGQLAESPAADDNFVQEREGSLPPSVRRQQGEARKILLLRRQHQGGFRHQQHLQGVQGESNQADQGGKDKRQEN